MSVQITKYAPADALKPFVDQYWEGIYFGSVSSVLHQKIVPSGFIEFILHLSNARCEININSGWEISSPFFLAGFWTRSNKIRFLDKVETFNIRFKPEAMYYLFGIPAAEFINRPDNLINILGTSFTSFCLQLEGMKSIRDRINFTDEYLLQRLYTSKKRFSYIEVACDLIRLNNCQISVEALSKEACISQRQLEREFKIKLGINPKTYMRIARFNMAQQLLNEQPNLSMAQLSYLSGYADQAHFVKDFKKITGEIPSAYNSEN